MINPEIRFTQINPAGLNLARRLCTIVLNKIHQQDEPRNTPITVIAADA
jgi:hypothetical protein